MKQNPEGSAGGRLRITGLKDDEYCSEWQYSRVPVHRLHASLFFGSNYSPSYSVLDHLQLKHLQCILIRRVKTRSY